MLKVLYAELFAYSHWKNPHNKRVKSVQLTGEATDKVRLMIEEKTETITLDELKAMVYAVIREST